MPKMNSNWICAGCKQEKTPTDWASIDGLCWSCAYAKARCKGLLAFGAALLSLIYVYGMAQRSVPIREKGEVIHGSMNVMRTFDWIGYQFTTRFWFDSLWFQEGIHQPDGGWFDTLYVQIENGGVWSNAVDINMNPSYAGPALPNFQPYGISFDRTSGEGIRLAGRPGGSATYISVAELRVFGEDAGPLPIQLVSFTGSDSSGVAVLRWTTASERNNFGFYVERDGVLLLNSFVHGHGTSNEVHTYSYRDASSGGRFIRRYRLKQLDLDGAVWWSRPVTLSIIHGAVQPSTQ